jgi:signal peptidase I
MKDKDKVKSDKRRKIVNVVFTAIQIVIVIVAISLSLAVILNPNVNNVEVGPGPIKLLPILSNSMSGNNKDSFNMGDLVVSFAPKDASNLKEGQIVTFVMYEGGSQFLNTHRITERNVDGNGNVSYRTKGDATENVDEQVVPANDVLAVYAFHVPRVGEYLIFLQEPDHFMFIIVVPLAVLFLWNIIVLVKMISDARAKAATSTVIEELKASIPILDEEEIKRKAIEEYLAKQNASVAGGEANAESVTEVGENNGDTGSVALSAEAGESKITGSLDAGDNATLEGANEIDNKTVAEESADSKDTDNLNVQDQPVEDAPKPDPIRYGQFSQFYKYDVDPTAEVEDADSTQETEEYKVPMDRDGYFDYVIGVPRPHIYDYGDEYKRALVGEKTEQEKRFEVLAEMRAREAIKAKTKKTEAAPTETNNAEPLNAGQVFVPKIINFDPVLSVKNDLDRPEQGSAYMKTETGPGAPDSDAASADAPTTTSSNIDISHLNIDSSLLEDGDSFDHATAVLVSYDKFAQVEEPTTAPAKKAAAKKAPAKSTTKKAGAKGSTAKKATSKTAASKTSAKSTTKAGATKAASKSTKATATKSTKATASKSAAKTKPTAKSTASKAKTATKKTSATGKTGASATKTKSTAKSTSAKTGSTTKPKT